MPAGDKGLVVELGESIDDAVNDRVLALDAGITAAGLEGVEETVPTYRSLMIVYDPMRIGFTDLAGRVRAILDGLPDPVPAPSGRRWVLPVVYGGAWGEDMAHVAATAGLPEAEIAARHAAGDYRVHMIGFQPGFAYLGGLDPALHLPRRTDPRARVPAGSVAIGGMQTAVYSVACPSGWHLVGRTPVRVFDPARREPFLLAAGDRVRFDPVPADAWEPLCRRVAAGELLATSEEGA